MSTQDHTTTTQSLAEARLARAERHADDVADVLASGGTVLPDPFDGGTVLGAWTLYVSKGADGYEYRCSSAALAKSIRFTLTRSEAVKAIRDYLEGLT